MKDLSKEFDKKFVNLRIVNQAGKDVGSYNDFIKTFIRQREKELLDEVGKIFIKPDKNCSFCKKVASIDHMSYEESCRCPEDNSGGMTKTGRITKHTLNNYGLTWWGIDQNDRNVFYRKKLKELSK